MEFNKHNRVWLEIDLSVLQDNYRKMVDAVVPCRVMGVLKANAYGLGVEPIARALVAAGCRSLGVAELNEALQLSSSGCQVQILGGVLEDEIEPAVTAGIGLPITDLDVARRISKIAVDSGRPAQCQFLIDTGMGRLGIALDDAVAVIKAVVKMPGLNCDGIYSHFPIAYRGGSDYTHRQIDRFRSLLGELKCESIEFSHRHIANSDAINNFPRSYAAPFNMVRSGINLHGCFDSEGQRILDMQPVLSLKSRLIAVRNMKKGEYIGYGCSYRVPHDMQVGVVAAGYADGLPLALSNRGHLLVHGRSCRVLGRVSMDYTTVSLENITDARCGDEVTCLGRQGNSVISVDDWAQIKDTHAYDIICSFGGRVVRRYLGGAL
jgi:alanine racemase